MPRQPDGIWWPWWGAAAGGGADPGLALARWAEGAVRAGAETALGEGAAARRSSAAGTRGSQKTDGRPGPDSYNGRGAMLEFRGVSKVYGRAGGRRVEALVDLSFEIKLAELAAVVGPGGAGKSTLLRLVTGEERPTRGAVLVAGVEVGTLGRGGLARLRRGLGIAPQGGRLLPDRTALGNLTFVLGALGVGGVEARERALAMLAEAGLGAARNAWPHELAEGECRRLLLVRALVTRPRLLLADEPTAMLDATQAGTMVALLRAAHGRGTTCLVATQAPDVARALEGRILQLAGGRLRHEGDPV